MIKFALALLVILAAHPAAAEEPAEQACESVVARWIATFSTNDPDTLTGLYTTDATSLGIVSPVLIDGSAQIRHYFSNLPGSGFKAVLAEHYAYGLGTDIALCVGFIDFTLVRDGKPFPNPGRYSMVITKRGSNWLIMHHHASARPKPPAR